MTHTALDETQPGDDAHSVLMSRRVWLGGALLLATASQAASSARPTSSVVLPDASEALRTMLRMQISLRAAAVPWFYSGRIFAVRNGMAPLHLYNFEGTEIYWGRPAPDGRWRVAVSTLTFFRDRETGAYLDEFANPLTGKTVRVIPNVLRSLPNQDVEYSASGLTAFGHTTPWALRVQRNAGLVWVESSMAVQGRAQPSLELQTMYANAADFDRNENASVPAHFSSTSFSLWSRWLEMGSLEGHLIWNAAGRKLTSLAELPRDYRARADAMNTRHFLDPGTDPVGAAAS